MARLRSPDHRRQCIGGEPGITVLLIYAWTMCSLRRDRRSPTLAEETFGQEDILFFMRLGGGRSQRGWVEAFLKKLHILVLYSYQLPVCSSHLSCEMRNMEETEGTTARWSKVKPDGFKDRTCNISALKFQKTTKALWFMFFWVVYLHYITWKKLAFLSHIRFPLTIIANPIIPHYFTMSLNYVFCFDWFTYCAFKKCK